MEDSRPTAQVEVFQRKGVEGTWDAQKRELTMVTKQSSRCLEGCDIYAILQNLDIYFK